MKEYEYITPLNMPKEKIKTVRDRLVIGIKDNRFQEKLLQYPNLKLAEAIQISRAMESSASTQKEMEGKLNLQQIDDIKHSKCKVEKNNKKIDASKEETCCRCGRTHQKK